MYNPNPTLYADSVIGDAIIGSFCIYNNFSLLHDDRDFDPLEKYLNLKAVQI